ncbi:DUF6651 domain-containing protein [Inquilinus sp. OTU3971]|uniref:DUF6651 domain-containing protein n=1 Tax=Inquilinus sp. OTU3971 TaxID=3043855 RepID=UPI00313B2CE8
MLKLLNGVSAYALLLDKEGEGAGGGGDPAADAGKDKKLEGGDPAADAGGGNGGDDANAAELLRLKNAATAAQTALDQANARLKDFEGLDPKEIRSLIAAQKKAEEDALAAKGDFETLKTRMADEHSRELGVANGRVKDLEDRIAGLTSTIENLTVGTAFNDSEYIKAELLLTPAKSRVVYGPHFDIVDGKMVGYDRPRGEVGRAAMVDARGNPLPFEEALKRLVEADPDRDHLLKSKLKPGAASTTQDKTTKTVESTNELSGMSRIAAALSKGGLKRK